MIVKSLHYSGLNWLIICFFPVITSIILQKREMDRYLSELSGGIFQYILAMLKASDTAILGVCFAKVPIDALTWLNGAVAPRSNSSG
jgi:hypothetical protein